MTIGSGILLFVIGAILAFAVHIELDFVDLNLVGYILMIAGAVIALLGLILLTTRRRRGVDPVDRETI